jgi:F420-dependent oxidoreductase-like protein
MKLAMHVRHLGDLRAAHGLIADLESAGLDVFNVSEAYTFDAVSQVGYLAALTTRAEIATTILNVFSRSAATIAMTAAGCDALTGGRFVLGLGTSGPQVIEGFHGVPFGSGVSRVRDYIEVTRKVLRREPLVYRGRTVTVPLTASDGGTERRPLKLIDHPVRDRVPIWWASITARAVEATAEMADGWLPAWFTPEQVDRIYRDSLDAGLARRSPDLGPLEISAQVVVGIGEDVDAVGSVLRPGLALYVGGMGSRATNFYNRLAVRYGYADVAAQLQELYLSGRREEAQAAVPADWIAGMTLAGPRERVRERLAAYRQAGVTVLDVQPYRDPVRAVADLRELLDAA